MPRSALSLCSPCRDPALHLSRDCPSTRRKAAKGSHAATEQKFLRISYHARAPFDGKVPYFPEHTEDELRADIDNSGAATWLEVASGFPRPGVYDFRREPALLKHAMDSVAVEYVMKTGGTLGWTTLVRARAEPLDLKYG